MFNVLKELFGPKAVVGLELTDRHICAIRVSNPLSSPEIERMAFREFERPGESADALNAFLTEEKIDCETVITALPTHLATIREITVPFDKPKKLRKIIKYQMETYVPFPIDDMVVDFLSSESGDRIVSVGIPKRVLADHLRLLAQADLAPRVVSLANVALFNLFVYTRKGESEAPASILHLDGGQIIVQIIYRDRLDFVRVVHGQAGHLEQLRETFALYRLKNARKPLKEVLLTGPSATNAGLSEEIAQISDAHVSLWEPFREIKHNLGDVDVNRQSRFGVALGLALSLSNGSPNAFDLRKEEFALETAADLKPLIMFMLPALLLIIALFTFNLYQKLYHQEAYYSSLEDSVRNVFLETFPDTTQIVKGREVQLFGERVSKEKGQYQWEDNFTTDGTVLDVLLNVTQVASRYPGMRIDNLSIDGKNIHMDGSASSFKIVDSLKVDLEKSDFFSNIKLVGAKADKRQNSIQFNFVLEKKS